MTKGLKPENVFKWDKYHSLIGKDFYFTFTDNKLNRFNVVNMFNTQLDQRNHYIGRVLTLLLSWAYVDSQGNLVTKLHGSQLNQIGMNREQRNDILTHSIADLINDKILADYKVVKE